MRPLLLLALFPAVVLAAPVAKPVVAMLPAQGTTPGLSRLGLLMESRAAELLEQSGGYQELHLKQVLAMARQEGVDLAKLDEKGADDARVLLGADRVITLRLTAAGAEVNVQGTLRGAGAPVTFSVVVPKAWSKALPAGSEAIAAAVLAQDDAKLPPEVSAQPASMSDAALISLGTCWEFALQNSMGHEAPVSNQELQTATSACQTALKADPSLRFATAVMASLLASERDDAEAKKLTDEIPAEGDALEPWTIARFWLLKRTQSHDVAVAYLQEVIKRHPQALILRAHLADSLGSANQHPKAIDAWNEYLVHAPSSPWAWGRLSRSLAKSGNADAALEAAQTGALRAPASREAALQLAGRQIDSKKYAEAVAVLTPFAAKPDATSEVLARLGWAHFLLNDTAKAGPLFKAAADRAKAPAAWRARGQALYDYGLVALREGRNDAAKEAYRKSVETGYVVASPDLGFFQTARTVAPATPVAVPAPDAGPPAVAAVTPPAPVAAPPSAPVPAPPPAKAMPTGPYVFVDKIAGKDPLTAELLALAQKLSRESVMRRGAQLAPEGEAPAAAVAAIKSQRRKGYQVSLTLAGKGEDGLKIDALVLSYPEKAVRGMWTVGASGAGFDDLIDAMVPKIIDDLAGDLDW